MADGEDVDEEGAPSPESPDPADAGAPGLDRADEDAEENAETTGADEEAATTEADEEAATTGTDEPPTDPSDPPFGDTDEAAFGEGEGSDSAERATSASADDDSEWRDPDESAFGDDRSPESDWTDHEPGASEQPPNADEPIADPEAANATNDAEAAEADDTAANDTAADDTAADDTAANDPAVDDTAANDTPVDGPDTDTDSSTEAAGGGVKPLVEDEREIHYDPDDPTESDSEPIEPEDLHGPPVDEEVATPADLDAKAPPDDQEMPLADHIDEMVKRLSVVVGVILVITLGVFPFAEEPIIYIWNNVLPPSELTAPRVYGPLELKLTELKFSMLAGFVIALPVFVYQTYLFMRPGLYPRERRYYLAAVPTSLVLAFIGLAFGYFLILPALFSYFLTYSQNAGQIAFALKQTFDLILMLEGYLALVFQIPLFIMLAIMMGLTTRDWLASRRIYFWGGFLGVSYLFGLDPTGVAPIMVAATMVVLFEGTLFLLKWTRRGN